VCAIPYVIRDMLTHIMYISSPIYLIYINSRRNILIKLINMNNIILAIFIESTDAMQYTVDVRNLIILGVNNVFGILFI